MKLKRIHKMTEPVIKEIEVSCAAAKAFDVFANNTANC